MIVNEELINSKVKILYEAGWQIVPGDKKHPENTWRKWQTTRIEPELLEAWLEQGKTKWCIITGALSGVVIIDADNDEAIEYVEKNLPKTLSLNTPRGRHYFFKYPDLEVRNASRLNALKLDRRGQGGALQLHEIPDWGKEEIDEFATYDPSWFPEEPKPTTKSANTGELSQAQINAAKIIADALDGQKHACLLKASRLMGGYVGGRQINKEDAEEFLFNEICKKDIKSESAALETIRNGIKYGMSDPITSPNSHLLLTSQFQQQQEKKPEVKKTRFKFYTSADMDKLPHPRFIVEGHIAEKTFGAIWGQSGSYKTFWAHDLGCCISTGVPFLGKFRINVIKPVVYLASEGFHGMAKRKQSWEEYYKTKSRILYVNDRFKSTTDIHDLISEATDIFKEVPLLFIDTLSCNFLGKDTDKNQEMTDWCNMVVPICNGTEVLATHHAGWSTSHERGASSLRDNSHTSISLTSDDSVYRVTCVKQKDFEPFESYGVSTLKVSASVILKMKDKEEDELRMISSIIGKTLNWMSVDEIKCHPLFLKYDWGKNTWLEKLDKAVDLGFLLKNGKGVKGDPYRYKK